MNHKLPSVPQTKPDCQTCEKISSKVEQIKKDVEYFSGNPGGMDMIRKKYNPKAIQILQELIYHCETCQSEIREKESLTKKVMGYRSHTDDLTVRWKHYEILRLKATDEIEKLQKCIKTGAYEDCIRVYRGW